MDALEVVDATPDHAIGTMKGTVLYVWRGTTTEQAAHDLGKIIRRIASHADGTPGVLLGVVETEASPPSSSARRVMSSALRVGSDFVCASALVFEGKGFQASMVRGVATGLALMARLPYPHQVFASVPTAAEWIESQLGRGGPQLRTATELRSSVQTLRAAH